MIRVVFDTVVFVRALINPRGTCGNLFFERQGEYELVVSPQIIAEVLEVVRRPKIAAKSPRFNAVNFRRVVECFERAETVVADQKLSVCRDPDDNKFLECALAGRAAYIVSEDNDLKDIGEFRGVKIIGSRDLLRMLESERQ